MQWLRNIEYQPQTCVIPGQHWMSHFIGAKKESRALRFGSWSGQLGDGRAMSLGHVLGFALDDEVTEVHFGWVQTSRIPAIFEPIQMNRGWFKIRTIVDV